MYAWLLPGEEAHPSANELLFGYQCLVTHRRPQTNNKPIQTALHSVLLCLWPQNVMQSGNILPGCDDRVLCSKALVNLEVLQSNCKERRRNMRRVNIYPSVLLTTTGPDRRRNVTADAFPLKFPAALPYSFISLVGFPTRSESVTSTWAEISSAPWVQRTQELPSLICSSAGSAVATLHFGFCSAAVRSASCVKKSKIKVRRRNDIHLARRHQGLPTSPDVHVCAMCIVCDLARPRSVLTLSWSNRETLAGLEQPHI